MVPGGQQGGALVGGQAGGLQQGGQRPQVQQSNPPATSLKSVWAPGASAITLISEIGHPPHNLILSMSQGIAMSTLLES